MKLRIAFDKQLAIPSYTDNGTQLEIEIDMSTINHQSPMLPVFLTVIKDSGKMGQAKCVCVNHLAGLKLGMDWNKKP